MQVILTTALHNYKVPVIIKKLKNFTFCLGKSRENFIIIFQDFPGLTNKIQGLSRTFQDSKKNPGLSRTFPGCGNPVKRIMGVHPTIYIFVQKLIQIYSEVKMDCHRLARDLAIARKKITKYVMHDSQLQLCQNRLDAGVYSTADFLNAAKHHIERFIPSGPL